MSAKNNAPNGSKSFDQEVNVDIIREYFKELLYKTYSNSAVETDDAIAIASLAPAIDKFITSSETERRAALVLKNDLSQIVYNSDLRNQIDASAKKKYSKSEKKLYTSDGRIVYLGNIIGSGGEGIVFKAHNIPGKVVKVFKPDADLDYMERKIEAIISNHVPSKLENVLISTIPEELLYDEDDKFAGYLMPWISTKFKLYDVIRSSPARNKYFPELNYKGLIIIAYNLAEAVNYMHEHNVVIGDLNYNNIVINTDGTVCLIDTDSYDFVDKETKEHFPCVVGYQEVLAPELQSVGSLRNGRFTKESDAFSLAILIFHILMNNADPFGSVKNSQYSESMGDIPANSSIINGECPYVKSIKGMKIPDWAPSFDLLPEYVQNLFVRTFDYSPVTLYDRIRERPSAEEWMIALMRFCHEPLKQCERDSFHWYRMGLDECPFCSKANYDMTSKRLNMQGKMNGILENLTRIITVGL